jgi:predicted oxidoreductase
MSERAEVVVVGGGVVGASAAGAVAANGARAVLVSEVTRLIRPGDVVRGVAVRGARGGEDVFEAAAVILADAEATLAAALAVGAERDGGGVLTDEHGRVLDAAQLPIPGLYAAGDEDAGQRAGTHAAARVAARPSR